MKKKLMKIKKIIKIDEEHFTIKVLFENDKILHLDLSELFKNPQNLTAEILRGNMFASCFIDLGALAWPNGFELCPDQLYQSNRHNKNRNEKKSDKNYHLKVA